MVTNNMREDSRSIVFIILLFIVANNQVISFHENTLAVLVLICSKHRQALALNLLPMQVILLFFVQHLQMLSLYPDSGMQFCLPVLVPEGNGKRVHKHPHSSTQQY